MKDFTQPPIYFKTHFLFPTALQALSDFVFYPYFKYSFMLKTVYRTVGFWKLWNGYIQHLLYYIPYFGMRFYTNALLQDTYNPENKTSNIYFYAAIAGGMNMVLLFPYTYAYSMFYRTPMNIHEPGLPPFLAALKKRVYDKELLVSLFDGLPKKILYSAINISLFFGLHASFQQDCFNNKPTGLLRMAGCWITTSTSNMGAHVMQNLTKILSEGKSIMNVFRASHTVLIFKASFLPSLIFYCYEEYREAEAQQYRKNIQ